MTSRVEVQRTRGTTAENDAYTGPEGMITVVTPVTGELRIHDGVTPGGFPAAGIPSLPLSTDLGGTGQSLLTPHAVLLGGMSPVGFATIGTANRVLADNGSGSDPTFKTITALLDAVFGSAQGDILQRGASVWQVLAPGTSGQFLKTQGASALAVWATPSAASLSAIADGDVLANISGGSAAPAATTATALLDYVFGATRGMILYRGASGWAALAAGTSGYLLQTQSTGADPQWVAPSAATAPTRTTGISAAGANQAAATQLTTDWNIVSTVAASTGVALRSGSTTGLAQWVFNAGANDLSVYTKNGDSAVINTLGTTAGFTIAPNSGVEFRPVSLTQWYSAS